MHLYQLPDEPPEPSTMEARQFPKPSAASSKSTDQIGAQTPMISSDET
jgi:hypothetical protein